MKMLVVLMLAVSVAGCSAAVGKSDFGRELWERHDSSGGSAD
jgi:hypothetical protein